MAMKNLLIFIILILMLCLNVFSQKAKDIHKINFKKVKYPIHQSLAQKDLTVEKIVFGDLDGDGKDEAAVRVLWSLVNYGGNGYGYYVYVYKLKNGSLALLSKMDGGSKSELFILKDILIKNSKLEIFRCEADKNFNNFSLATIFYELKNNKPVQVQKISKAVDEQCYLD